MDEGLAAGDKIIYTGTTQLDDGAGIQPQPVDADSVFRTLGYQNPAAGD